MQMIVVNPLWFGIGIGVFGTVVLEMVLLVTYAICTSKDKEKNKNETS